MMASATGCVDDPDLVAVQAPRPRRPGGPPRSSAGPRPGGWPRWGRRWAGPGRRRVPPGGQGVVRRAIASSGRHSSRPGGCRHRRSRPAGPARTTRDPVGERRGSRGAGRPTDTHQQQVVDLGSPAARPMCPRRRPAWPSRRGRRTVPETCSIITEHKFGKTRSEVGSRVSAVLKQLLQRVSGLSTGPGVCHSRVLRGPGVQAQRNVVAFGLVEFS